MCRRRVGNRSCLSFAQAHLACHSNDSGFESIHFELDSHVFGFAILLSLTTTVLFALMPALRLIKVDPQMPLKEQSASGGSSGAAMRKGLIVAQVVLTTILLAGAGLFTQSLRNINHVNLGLVTDHVIQFSISPELNGHNPAQTTALLERVRKAITALPGVVSASAAEGRVLANSSSGGDITVEGYAPVGDEDTHTGENWVAPEYFSTLQIPLLVGREFREADTAESPKVAIINEKLARRYFAGRDAIGKHLIFKRGNVTPDIEIVGIVKDSKHNDSRSEIVPFAWMPYTQQPKLGRATSMCVPPRIRWPWSMHCGLR